jgi:hypothetical protein
MSRSLAVCTSRRQMLRIMLTATAAALVPQLGFRLVFADSSCIKEYPPANLADCPNKKHHEGHTSTMNGCGPQSGTGSDWPIPQGFGNAPYFPSCDGHDCCYGGCGNSKAACDLQFLQGLVESCAHAYPNVSDALTGSVCLDMATLFYSAVALGGADAYDSAQKEDCECCHPIPAQQIYCGCTHTCYTDPQVCLQHCKATLGCFTDICGPATRQQCPPPPT